MIDPHPQMSAAREARLPRAEITARLFAAGMTPGDAVLGADLACDSASRALDVFLASIEAAPHALLRLNALAAGIAVLQSEAAFLRDAMDSATATIGLTVTSAGAAGPRHEA